VSGPAGDNVTTTDNPTGAYAWLDSGPVRAASDAVLGAMLLIAGTLAIWDSREASFLQWDPPDGMAFPMLIGALLLAVGVLLMARAAFVRRPQPAPGGLRRVAILAASVAAAFAAPWLWGLAQLLIVGPPQYPESLVAILGPVQILGFSWLLSFGPPEHAAAIILLLVTIAALARRSRLQAVGLMLFGFLLAAIGLDPITGQLRLIFGLEELFGGIPSPLLFLGLIVVGDGLICLLSPPLWLATYAWIEPRWRQAAPPLAAAIFLRVVAALAVAACCTFAYIYTARMWEVGLVLAVGAFGVAGKVLGWNRLVPVIACVYGDTLEQSLRQTMLMTQGDLAVLVERPVSRALLIACVGIIALTILLSVSSRRSPRPTPT
jgi:hypothetical protein